MRTITWIVPCCLFVKINNRFYYFLSHNLRVDEALEKSSDCHIEISPISSHERTQRSPQANRISSAREFGTFVAFISRDSGTDDSFLLYSTSALGCNSTSLIVCFKGTVCPRGFGELQLVEAIALAPLTDRLLQNPGAFRNHPSRVCTHLDRSPDLRRRRRLFVKGNQHVESPSRTSRRIDGVMNSADRQESM